ncbi:nucleotide exchange factor GrpE [Hydrogenibacillus sp. N12]|uniref:nucleotide exchange factor GrpE n=1 Tax=Hydrogenibacillus sp. N12 TaxID=2866627 RepID=UPI001C7D5EEE|nr:nucleotide exchange factor GrpE [Hydrogenibacillus sp. N12]QZA32120.1 nucleotide exchange factor GrpE [Hydrogenibacillus sp. N12]
MDVRRSEDKAPYDAAFGERPAPSAGKGPALAAGDGLAPAGVSDGGFARAAGDASASAVEGGDDAPSGASPDAPPGDGAVGEAAEPEAAEAPDPCAGVLAEKAEAEREAAEWRERYVRLAADFDNYKKRQQREREALIRYGPEPLAERLLPILDTFERALAQAMAHLGAGGEKAEAPGAEAVGTGAGAVPADVFRGFVDGVDMVYRQLLQALDAVGVRPVEAVGQPFDPAVHHAVGLVPKAEGLSPGTVAEELQKGYRLHDKLLRPAMVKVVES